MNRVWEILEYWVKENRIIVSITMRSFEIVIYCDESSVENR